VSHSAFERALGWAVHIEPDLTPNNSGAAIPVGCSSHETLLTPELQGFQVRFRGLRE